MASEYRSARFWHNPMLQNFVAYALKDAQFRENDEARHEERDERDTGTVWTVALETFGKLAELCDKFRDECAEHIAAAIELEPGADGFEYARPHAAMTHERLGGKLWLAITGTGVTFTDDGNAPCLEAMTEWSRANSKESLYFGDDGEMYLC